MHLIDNKLSTYAIYIGYLLRVTEYITYLSINYNIR